MFFFVEPVRAFALSTTSCVFASAICVSRSEAFDRCGATKANQPIIATTAIASAPSAVTTFGVNLSFISRSLLRTARWR